MNVRLLKMLRTETRLTSRLGRVPCDDSFSKRGWRREKLDVAEGILDGAEYVKDGLLPCEVLYDEIAVAVRANRWARLDRLFQAARSRY